MIPRFIEKQVLRALIPGRVTGIFGARRTGKTILMKKIRSELKNKKILSVLSEDLNVAEILSSQRLNVLEDFARGYDYLFIDEAQKIPKIGLNLKLIVDGIPDLPVLVTGSSSFDLRNKIGEPLVGRCRYFHLHPFAQLELKDKLDYLALKENMENTLIFGSYPQVFTAKNIEEKRKILESIRDGYLLKDILSIDNLKDSLFVFNLLRLIAFQTGQDVSYSELASSLNANKKTVMRYLELLEKSFVLFSLPGYSRNLRKEYTKTPRYYFWDNGIRNTVISNYNRLNLRDDVGRLWENFCISERLKKVAYKNISANHYFWRTYTQKEIDYVEESEGKIRGYEFKWKANKTKPPKDFLEAYKNSSWKVINQENYLDFLT